MPTEPPTCPRAPLSWGELIDKITILEIKSERLTTPEALQNVRHELHLLDNVIGEIATLPPRLLELKSDLRSVNQRLWEIEDAIRGKEAQKLFDEEFIELARCCRGKAVCSLRVRAKWVCFEAPLRCRA